MSTKDKSLKTDLPGARYDPEMDKYNGVILFPEKLAAAEESIKNSNLVEFIKQWEELEAKKEK